MSDPASIRYWNPGGMYPGSSASRYGSARYETIGGGHKIAVFPDAESGAAAQFDLLANSYAGMPLAELVRKWSGGNSNAAYTAHLARSLGIQPDAIVTRDMLANPSIGIPFAKAAAQWEAGRAYPMTDEQWASAHGRVFSDNPTPSTSMPPAMALGAPKPEPAPGPVTWPAYHPMRPEPTIPARPSFDARAFWEDQERGRFAAGGHVHTQADPTPVPVESQAGESVWFDNLSRAKEAEAAEALFDSINSPWAPWKKLFKSGIPYYTPRTPVIDPEANTNQLGHEGFKDGGAVSKALRLAERQTDKNPTEAQKESGNYAKGKFRWNGLEIAVENPKGAKRSGVDKNGKPWTCVQPATYGYLLKTHGADGDHVDVYVGDDHASDKVFVVDQLNADSGKFDEHKAMLGFSSKAAAVQTYAKAFSDGKAKDRLGAVTEMSVDAFKSWVRDGNTKKPMDKTMAKDKSLQLARQYASGGRVGYAEGGELPVDPFAMSPVPEGGNNPFADWWSGLDENARAMALEYAQKSRWDIGREALQEAAPMVVAGALGPVAQGIGRAVPALGRTASALAARFPKTTGAVEGMTAVGLVDAASRYLSPASAQGAKGNTQGVDVEAVKELQRELKAKGYYQGPIDGRMEGGTAKAKEAYERDKAASEQRTLELERAKSAATKENASLKAAEATIAETERKRLEDERKATDRAAGEKRFKEIEENTPWYRQAYRDWAPSLGYVLGAGAGVLSRKGIVSKADALSKKVAERADDLMAPPRGDLNDRVGKVNQFWTEGQPPPGPFGGASREGPFLTSQGATSFKANPAAPASGDLYLPNKTANLGRDLGVAGLYGAESAIAQFGLRNPAYEELERARKAADENPSEININAYQVARDRAAFGELLTNFGRSGAALSLGSGVKYQREGTRPNVSTAESERLAILDALRLRGVKPSPSSGPSAPQALTAQSAPAQLSAPPALQLPAPTPVPAALPARTATGTQPSSAKPSSAPVRPEWASDPPTGVILKKGEHWDARVGQPRKAGSFSEVRYKAPRQSTKKDSAKGSKKSKGNEARTDEPTAKITDPNDPAYWSGKLTDGMKDGGALGLARKYAGKLKRAFGGRTGYAHGGAPDFGQPTVADRMEYPIITPIGESTQPRAPGYEEIAAEQPLFPLMYPRGWPKEGNGRIRFQGDEGEPLENSVPVLEDNIAVRRADGGAIGLARAYANGGHVESGPIVGHDGGRDDTKPISVPSGAYIIPSDCVSGIAGAGGNTLAGMRILEKMFGKPSPEARSSGGAVPIVISDGEYVLSPEQVAKVGGGDVSKGHRVLDAMVRKVRADHVAQLKSLPGPAKA